MLAQGSQVASGDLNRHHPRASNPWVADFGMPCSAGSRPPPPDLWLHRGGAQPAAAGDGLRSPLVQQITHLVSQRVRGKRTRLQSVLVNLEEMCR